MTDRMFKIISYSVLLLLTLSCSRELMEVDAPRETVLLPEGVPVTVILPFSNKEMLDVEVRTKAESSAIDESRIHDLYVMIFDKDDLVDDPELGITDSPRRIYGRYFSYDHLESSLSALEANENECWFVENKDIGGTVSKTTGAVKVSTITRNNATLVVIANVGNSVTNMDGQDALDRLRAVTHLKELQGIEVCLEQDVVNRKDLFLMTGSLDVNTREMNWGTLPKDYDSNYTVSLTPVDAKVKFRVKVNETNISAVTPVYWQVINTPDRCFLDSAHNEERPPEDIHYFKSQQYYFEGSETIGGDTYFTFCFYMLENRLFCNKSATNYYQREIRKKNLTGEESDRLQDAAGEGYSGSYDQEAGQYYVNNGDWEYAPTNGSYVQFDLVLTLTDAGIADMGSVDTEGLTIGQALTSDAIFTVHLGDFSSSGKPDGWSGFDNYRTERGNCYTYTITINNTRSIYTEVALDREVQAGQEGFLLLTDAEIINADCHYEYHQICFEYRPEMTQDKFSWYVKTPFGEGGPDIVPLEDEFGNPTGEYAYEADGGTYSVGGIQKTGPKLDYRWVKFGLNAVEGGKYTVNRHKYPGDGCYDPSWRPGLGGDIPELMDITQLIEYIFYETDIETRHRENGANPASAFLPDDSDPHTTESVMRFTAFIDEFYYEHHPLEEDSKVDPELWRKFVNAQPREMHILSDARQSRDRCSDVILSSHSIIQQSIQTIYNIHAPSLKTIWGTEHQDEMREKSSGWPYWPGDDLGGRSVSAGRSGRFDEVGKWNGRLNSAWIWDFYSSQGTGGSDKTNNEWETFLDYDVDNDTPELKAAYQGMAYSCLSRNRDNDGDGKVDRNEVRWYLAAADQLVGMWIGNESLSINARLYRPAEGQWRSHIISSSGKKVCWAEEGGGATDYTWDFEDGRYTWDSVGEAAAGESVRCLRNIGTYEDGGTLKDISEAPYSKEIDPYFTLTDKGDGSYSFHFDRINPKAIRELSEGELPYHDQFSISNCVYLQFETQKKSDNVGDGGEYSVKLQDVNPQVTALGYNPYCPPGYRFPNQSEMVLMSLYLPSDYLKTSKDGVAYPGTYIPTRTYYDRGMFGTVRTGMSSDEIAQEAGGTNSAGTKFTGKVGWVYDTSKSKQSCMRGNQDAKRFRCVRDVGMTGFIEGGIMMKSNEVCPNDPVELSLNFFSSGAAFVSASLKLCYTDREGSYHEKDIPVSSMPAGMQYLYDQKVTMPTLTSLGLEVEDLDTDLKNMSFKITLRNAVTSKTFVKNITLSSHLTDCAVTLPAVCDPAKGMPVHVNIGSRNHYSKLSDVVLYWKEAGGSWNQKDLVAHDHYNEYSGDWYLKDIIGDASWETEANRYKEYLFYVVANCDDGTSYVSEVLSQQLIRLNYIPNPVPAGGWTDISQCNTIWSDAVTGLDFSNGDFIEVDMDLTNCRYKYIDGNKNHDIGQDNIIGFSIDNFNTAGYPNDTKTIRSSLIWYYPSVEHLVDSDDPADWGKIQSRVHAGKWSAYTPTEGVLTRMNLILDKDGLIRDGTRWTANPGDWNSRIKPALTSASTVYVGSIEGVHHSRATYNYIRVVRVQD